MAASQDMIDNVRLLCGDPDTTEMPDATIKSHLDKFALRWVNKRRPTKLLTSFTTVEDQQDYDVIPSTAYQVNQVYWLPGDYDFFGGVLARYYIQGIEDVDRRLAGFSVLENPSLSEAIYKALTEHELTYRGEGWQTAEFKIRLNPYPTADDDAVYFDYWAPQWTDVSSSDLLARYQDAVEHIGAVYVLRSLAVKRGLIRGSRGVSTGGGQNELELIKQYRAEAEANCPQAEMALGRG